LLLLPKIVESDSGDDLGTLQNIFQDAKAPQDGTIDPMTQIIADLKMKRMRILGADVYCDLDASRAASRNSIAGK